MQWSTKPQNSPYPPPKWAIEGSNEAEGEEAEFGAGVDLRECEGGVSLRVSDSARSQLANRARREEEAGERAICDCE